MCMESHSACNLDGHCYYDDDDISHLWFQQVIVIPDLECSAQTFHDIIVGCYPKLQEAGGFELLRCRPNSRDLMTISQSISSVPRLLKRWVGNGKVYVRPLQRELSLEAIESEEVEGVSDVACMHFHMTVCAC